MTPIVPFGTRVNFTAVKAIYKPFLVTMAIVFAAATSAFATIEWQWQFNSGANPATPQIGDPSATAAITVGPFGAGWHDDWVLGSATGYWDLGMNGSITLTIPNLASPSQSHNATLSIVQWVDDFLFTGNLTYGFAGATQVGGTTTHLLEDTGFGRWVEYETVWTVLAGSDPSGITITGPADGAILAGITARITVVPEPTTLIAGALLLLPFGASTFRRFRKWELWSAKYAKR